MKHSLKWMLVGVLTMGIHVARAESNDIGERAALSITSKPSASPKSPAVLADTTFSASATGSGSLTYAWDFGDGTPLALGASVVHNFAASGTFNTVLTVTDSTGASLTSPLAVVVTDSITSPKLLITLNFKNPGNDTIFFTGTLRIPPGSKLDGQSLVLSVGGVPEMFTLNALGQATNANGSVKVFVKPQVLPNVELVSTLIVRVHGDFQAALAANANLTNRNANRDPVKVKATATFLGISCSATMTQTFIAHQGLRGMTR